MPWLDYKRSLFIKVYSLEDKCSDLLERRASGLGQGARREQTEGKDVVPEDRTTARANVS